MSTRASEALDRGSTPWLFAAALATIPVLVMVGYLLAARRTGALDNL